MKKPVILFVIILSFFPAVRTTLPKYRQISAKPVMFIGAAHMLLMELDGILQRIVPEAGPLFN